MTKAGYFDQKKYYYQKLYEKFFILYFNSRIHRCYISIINVVVAGVIFIKVS